jgi:thiol:disulfide interchange protein
LLGALLGGLILNLMPCVFPVLAIKVVSFTQHADDRRGHRRAAWPTPPAWCCRSWRWAR